MDEFTLTITLGNSEMETPMHVAKALREVAKKLERDYNALSCANDGKIMDVNGNSVGSWEVK